MKKYINLTITVSIVFVVCLFTYLYLEKRIKTAALSLNPAINQLYEYELDYRTESSVPKQMALMTGAKENEAVTIQFKGSLSLYVNKLDHDEIEFAFLIKSKESNDGAEAILPESVSGLVRVIRTGDIIDFSLPASALAGPSLIATELIRNFFPNLNNRGSREWKSQYLDQIYLWSLHQDGSRFSIERHQQASEKSLSTYLFNKESNFLSKVLVDQFPNPMKLNQNLTRTNIIFKQVAQNENSTAFLSSIPEILKTASVKEDISNSAFKMKQQLESQKRILGVDTAETLVAKLKEMSAEDRQENMEIYSKIKALLALNPLASRQFFFALLEYNLNDERFVVPATALTAVGSEEAQKVLREALLSSESDEKRQIRLIPNLTFVEDPDLETESAIRDLTTTGNSEEIRRTADRGLGTIAHNLIDNDIGRSTLILRHYVDKLDVATTASDKVEQLSIIGNIGIASQYEVIKPLTADSDANVRYEAAQALRFVEPALAADTLLKITNGDEVAKVKEGASEAMRYQGAISDLQLQSLKTSLYQARNILVVKNLIETLSHQREYHPSAVNIIREYSQQCGHPDLCGYVENVLQSITSTL